MEVAAFAVFSGEAACILDVGLGGGRKVSRSAEERRHDFCKFLENGSAGSAGCDRLFDRCCSCELSFQVCGKFFVQQSGDKFCLFGICFDECLIFCIPCGSFFFQFSNAGVDHFGNFCGDVEFCFGETEVLLGGCEFVNSEGFTMGVCLTGLCGRTESDDACANDKCRSAIGNFSLSENCINFCNIVCIFDAEDAPAVCFETESGIFGESDSGIAFDGDAVVIVENNNIIELLVSCERSCFVGDTFHHTAVAGDDVDFAVEKSGISKTGNSSETFCSNSHTDTGSKTCSERTGGDFNTACVTVFRMSGGQTFPLTELFQVVHGQTIAEEVKKAVNQHGTVSCGKDKAVATEPLGVLRIVFHVVVPEGERNICGSHRHTGMTGFCFLHTFCGKQADCVCCQLQ